MCVHNERVRSPLKSSRGHRTVLPVRYGPVSCLAPDWAERVTCYGTVSLAQTFARRRSTSGLPREAPKFRAPAAKTFALDGVS